MADGPHLSAELMNRLLRRLMSEWETLNHRFFHGAMKAPQIRVVDAEYLGRWAPGDRSVALQRRLLLERAWPVVLEVLKHEMAHQYVQEVLRVVEPPHGPAFRRVCARLGVDAAASGVPEIQGGEEGADTAEDRAIRRILRLLALAESPNAHEAEQATKAAQRLLLLHNLDMQARAAPQRYGFRAVGEIRGRHDAWEQVLGSVLGTFFFVRCVWVFAYEPRTGGEGTVLEISGTAANLEIAAHAHAFLTAAAGRAWEEYRRRAGLAGNAERRRFLAGVMMGFHDQLRAAEERHRQEGLILAADAGLGRYHEQRHPSTRRRAGVRARQTEAFSEGVEVGQRLVLRRAMEGEAGYKGGLLEGPIGPGRDGGEGR